MKKRKSTCVCLKSREDWNRWSRTERPPDIPSAPWVTYKDSGWNGYADWLGKNKRSAFLPYEEAKKVVNALGLKSQDDWRRWSRTERPPEIPGDPRVKYKDSGWNGYADWLGDSKSCQHFCPITKQKRWSMR